MVALLCSASNYLFSARTHQSQSMREQANRRPLTPRQRSAKARPLADLRTHCSRFANHSLTTYYYAICISLSHLVLFSFSDARSQKAIRRSLFLVQSESQLEKIHEFCCLKWLMCRFCFLILCVS